MALADSGIDELVRKGELKDQFKQRNYLDQIYVTGTTTGLVTSICFAPKSKTFRGKAKYHNTVGDKDGTCPKDNLDLPGCYICLPE